MICPAIPEKCTQYHNPAAALGCTLSKSLHFPIRERHQTFPETSATSKSLPNFNTPRISLDFSQCVNDKNNRLKCRISLASHRTEPGESRPRSRSAIFEFNATILSNHRPDHQKSDTASRKPQNHSINLTVSIANFHITDSAVLTTTKLRLAGEDSEQHDGDHEDDSATTTQRLGGSGLHVYCTLLTSVRRSGGETQNQTENSFAPTERQPIEQNPNQVGPNGEQR